MVEERGGSTINPTRKSLFGKRRHSRAIKEEVVLARALEGKHQKAGFRKKRFYPCRANETGKGKKGTSRYQKDSAEIPRAQRRRGETGRAQMGRENVRR